MATNRFCSICKEPLSEVINGKEIFLRCKCDVQRVWYSTAEKIVHEEFITGPRYLIDWNPPLFKNGGGSIFSTLIKVQKSEAIKKIYNFCFKINANNKMAMYDSLNNHRTLFIRGPKGSGKGLLTVQFKFWSIWQSLKCTPLPADWNNFRIDIMTAENYGKIGDEARDKCEADYQNVDIFILENLKALRENKRIKGSDYCNSMMINRNTRPTVNIFSGEIFAKEIGSNLGEIFHETLEESEKILLFSPKEGNILYEYLQEKYLKLKDNLQKFDFNELFPCLDELSCHLHPVKLEIKKGDKEEYEKWKAAKNTTTNKIKRIEWAKSLINPVLADRMNDSEKIETIRLMSLACSGEQNIKQSFEEGRQALKIICEN